MHTFNITVSNEGQSRIEKIRKEQGFREDKDVWNSAMVLYEWYLRNIAKGREVAAIDHKNNHYRVVGLRKSE